MASPGQRQGDEIHISLNVNIKVYLIPDGDEKLFYPYHHISRNISFESREIDDAGLPRIEVKDKSKTILKDNFQITVEGPGGCDLTFNGATSYHLDEAPDNVKDYLQGNPRNMPLPNKSTFEMEADPAKGDEKLSIDTTLTEDDDHEWSV